MIHQNFYKTSYHQKFHTCEMKKTYLDFHEASGQETWEISFKNWKKIEKIL